MRVRLFGQPQFQVGDARVAFRGPARALSLVTYLLLHREQLHARAEIAFLLWPDLPESEARATLREYLRHARSALPSVDGEAWILADTRTVRWNPAAPAWLDVAEFERLAVTPATAARAVDLYRGDLASPLDDEWLQGPRERLRAMQTALLSQFVAATRRLGDGPRAAGYAERLLRHDPWREDAVRALIELRHEMGDRAGALHFYHDFAERLRAEMGVDPMTETTDAFERVRLASEGRPLKRERAQHNLPPALNTFVGRESALSTISAAVTERRFVTLIGTGGVGKTRLALETARKVMDRFGDGVWFVELAPLSDPALIVSAVAGVVGLQNASRESLLAALEDKSVLLVLDNCEHLIEGTASFVEQLLGVRGDLHILATSREPLRVAGERTERVTTLGLPAMRDGAFSSVHEIQQAPAVRLFLERAADVAPAYWIREEESDRRALIAISRQLDGIPLAIEFAAAQAGGFSLEVLARRLEDRFALLTAGRRTALPRQQTLRATLDWSYDLLTPLEQRVLRRIGIFVGGCTLEAAIAVCCDAGLLQTSIVDALGSLAEKSLVIADRGPSLTRYRLLETTRAYAAERLENAGEYSELRQSHSAYFFALAERIDATWQYAETGTRTPAERTSELKFEMDNWRAVLTWAIDGGNDPGLGARLVGSLRWLFATLALYGEGTRWCERALHALGSDSEPANEAAVQLALATMMGTYPFYQRFYPGGGYTERFLEAAIRATELFRVLQDRARLSLALSMTAMYLRMANRSLEADAAASEAIVVSRSSERYAALAMALYAKSFAIDPDAFEERAGLLKEALELVRSIRSPYSKTSILLALAELSFEAGDAVRALAYARECRVAFESMSSLANLAQLEINIAAYLLAVGEASEARSAARNALSIGQRIGEPQITARTLQLFAGIAVAHEDYQRGARLLGAAEARIAIGQSRLFTELFDYDRTFRGLRLALSEAQLASLMSEGHDWPISVAVEEAASA